MFEYSNRKSKQEIKVTHYRLKNSLLAKIKSAALLLTSKFRKALSVVSPNPEKFLQREIATAGKGSDRRLINNQTGEIKTPRIAWKLFKQKFKQPRKSNGPRSNHARVAL